MSTPYIITTPTMRYRVVDDLRIVNRVLVFGAIQDEAMLREPASQIRIQLSRPDLRARVSSGGYFAISGRPDVTFANPASLPAVFDATLSARGYRDLTVLITIPGPPYPIAGPVALLRNTPVTIQGRVTDAVTPATPQANATIAAAAAEVIATRTVLHFDHAAGVSIRRRTPSAAGAPTTFATAATTGAQTIALASVAGIASNALLKLGPDEAGEFAVVNAVDAGGSTVSLTAPIGRSFASGVTVQRMNRGASTASQALTEPAFKGEGLLRIAAALPGTILQIDDAGREEFHARGVVSDANGFFVLAGIAGVRTLELIATAVGFNPLTIAVALDYARPAQQVDFRLTP